MNRAAWANVAPRSEKRGEFARRAAFALIASLAAHDKAAGDRRFVESLRLIERGANDERNFVRKGVGWAVRGVGRRNPALKSRAVTVARRAGGRTPRRGDADREGRAPGSHAVP